MTKREEEYKKAQQLIKRMERSITKRQLLNESYSLELVGLPETLLTVSKTDSLKELRRENKQRLEYLNNSYKYGLTNIGSEEDKFYEPIAAIREFKHLSSTIGLRKKNISDIVRSVTNTYIVKDASGKLIEKEKVGVATVKGQEDVINVYYTASGKPLFNKRKINIRDPRVFTRVIDTTGSFERTLGQLRSQKNEYTVDKTERLMYNYIKALSKNVSQAFADTIANAFQEIKITPLEFYYLFITSELFTFEFIYDEVVGGQSKSQEISDRVEFLRSQKNKDMKSFEKEILSAGIMTTKSLTSPYSIEQQNEYDE